MNEDEKQTQETEAQDGTSRGDFLKWSTVALGGLYVGPKVTSFAVAKGGQPGSPPPNHPQVPPPGPPTYTLPPTGGAAGTMAPAGGGIPAWLPAAGVGAAAVGLYAKKQAGSKALKAENGGSEDA